MKQSKHENRKSFAKWGLTGQNNGEKTVKQSLQSARDILRHRQSSRPFAIMQSRGNIPFHPHSILSDPGTARHVLTLKHYNKNPKYRQLVTGQIVTSKP